MPYCNIVVYLQQVINRLILTCRVRSASVQWTVLPEADGGLSSPYDDLLMLPSAYLSICKSEPTI